MQRYHRQLGLEKTCRRLFCVIMISNGANCQLLIMRFRINRRSVPVRIPGSTDYCPFPDARCDYALLSWHEDRRENKPTERKVNQYELPRVEHEPRRIHVAHLSLRFHPGNLNNSIKAVLAGDLREAKELGLDMNGCGCYGASVNVFEGNVQFYGMVEDKVSQILNPAPVNVLLTSREVHEFLYCSSIAQIKLPRFERRYGNSDYPLPCVKTSQDSVRRNFEYSSKRAIPGQTVDR